MGASFVRVLTAHIKGHKTKVFALTFSIKEEEATLTPTKQLTYKLSLCCKTIRNYKLFAALETQSKTEIQHFLLSIFFSLRKKN